MKKLLAMLMLAAAMTSPAWACGPPEVGEKISYKDGPLLEIVKVEAPDCDRVKIYVCTVSGKRSCRWIKQPFLGVTWDQGK